jgi:hypothetical protein
MPTDEGVLNTLAYTFKACRAERDLAQCYENALKLQPNNEAFMADLFFCYLRMVEPKKMQLLSQRLYKLTGKSMYVFWCVSSMQLQNDLPPAMLTVAERMVEKAFNEGPGSAHKPGDGRPPVYMSVCLSVCLSAHLCIYLSICQSVCLCTCLSVRISVCLCVCLSVCLSVCHCVCLSVCHCVRMCDCLCVYLSVCPFACLFACVSLSDHVHLLFYVRMFLYLSLSLSVRTCVISTDACMRDDTYAVISATAELNGPYILCNIFFFFNWLKQHLIY